MKWPNPGDRVRMTGLMTNDPDPIPVGMEGTVVKIYTAVGQIDVNWDPDPEGRRRSLLLLPTDPFIILGES